MLCCTLLVSACGLQQGQSDRDSSQESSQTPFSGLDSSNSGLTPLEDLEDDTLYPPEQAELSITAQTGVLTLQWQVIDAQTRARLFQYDALTGGETLILEFNDPTIERTHLPSRTHSRAWHREQYRVELCTIDDCVSSPRIALSGLAANTISTLAPAVFLKGERYAEDIALNHDASVAVLTLPLAGNLDIQGRVNGNWTLLQSVSLQGLPASASRTLQVALSDSGDTIAVFIHDAETSEAQIRILERLGEAWQQIAEWPIEMQDSAGALREALKLSSSGDQLLVQHDQQLLYFRQWENGWSSTAQSLKADDITDAPGTESEPLTERLISSTSNAGMTRIFSVSQHDQSVYLDIWTPSESSLTWTRAAHLQLQGFDAQAPLAIASNTDGSTISIAGWEDAALADPSPVMWRYSIETRNQADTAGAQFDFMATDSLRAPPSNNTSRDLIFASNDSLSIIALGWNSAEPVDAEKPDKLPDDAALSTYQFDTQSRQWFSALELPEHLSTLAKQSFAKTLVLAADGETMMMTIPSDATNSTGSRIGEVLVMR